MITTSIFDKVIFKVFGLPIMGSIVLTWAIMALLVILGFAISHKLQGESNTIQVLFEGAFLAIQDAIESMMPDHSDVILPFIGTLWIYILIANILGIIPGLSSPTSDLSVTSALAILVFLSVHWFGITLEGLKKYLRHYLYPNPIMLPFLLISEISRTLALAVRLFGNVMSLEIAAVLVLMVAGFLVPIPLLMLHLVEAIIQAYLFGMLALIYICGALQSQELRSKEKKSAKK